MKRLYVHVGAALGVTLLLSIPALSQITQPARHTATVIGTVTDVNGGVIPNATVVLREAQNNQPPTILATRNGLFQFNDVAPGSTFQLSISAKDFSDWTSPLITVHPGQFKIVTGIQLRIATARTIVDVQYDPVEVATEQFKLEKSSAYSESFRIFTFPMRAIRHH